MSVKLLKSRYILLMENTLDAKGTDSGILASDVISIAGLNIPQQYFGKYEELLLTAVMLIRAFILSVAQEREQSSASGDGQLRGILGLGLSAGTQVSDFYLSSTSDSDLKVLFKFKLGKPTVLDNIIAAHSLASKMFGLYLGRRSVIGSELSIGAANPAHYTGSITYFDVLSTDSKHVSFVLCVPACTY